jgi:hypothetical protein
MITLTLEEAQQMLEALETLRAKLDEPMVDGYPLYSGLPPIKVQDEREANYKSFAQSAQVIGGQYDPRRKWVGLTDEEIDKVAASSGYGYIDVARAIEAKLREKNNG